VSETPTQIPCLIAREAARDILFELSIQRTVARHETLVVSQGPQPCPRAPAPDDEIPF
jgi:hypothetical protein